MSLLLELTLMFLIEIMIYNLIFEIGVILLEVHLLLVWIFADQDQTTIFNSILKTIGLNIHLYSELRSTCYFTAFSLFDVICLSCIL